MTIVFWALKDAKVFIPSGYSFFKDCASSVADMVFFSFSPDTVEVTETAISSRPLMAYTTPHIFAVGQSVSNDEVDRPLGGLRLLKLTQGKLFTGRNNGI